MADRPAHIKPPAYLTKSPPVPAPEAADSANQPEQAADSPDPTRYGDWTLKGIAVDF